MNTENENKVIFISGISGSGKSTISNILCKNNSWIYIDQDWFYKVMKPKIILSNKKEVSNWDCLEAINWEMMNNYLIESLLSVFKGKIIIICGFCPAFDFLKININKHIHLKPHNNVNLENFCIESRKKSKKLKNEEQDKLVIKELVIPFYNSILEQYKSKIDKIIEITDSTGQRYSCDEIKNKILAEI